MAKYSAEELSARINDLAIDDDLKISLMEDITDSLSQEDSEELTALKDELESTKAKFDELSEKYKARFLKAVEEPVEEPKDEEELEEKEVIDIKEI